jgi:hypothetical protein
MVFAASFGMIPALASAWAIAASNASIPRTCAFAENTLDISDVLNKLSIGSDMWRCLS